MGLDAVELVMEIEDAFGLGIPDEDAEEMITPGHVVRYLERRLDQGQPVCLEQRAFHALRRAGVLVLERPRAAFRPNTPWDAVLPVRRRRRAWKFLHHAVGVRPWPVMWPWSSVPKGHAIMGDTARYLATYAPAALQKPGAGWSRAQIEATLRVLICEQLGLDDFEWDQSFIQDLGVS